MTSADLFAQALERLQQQGTLGLPFLYVDYLDSQTKQDCLEVLALDVPERVESQMLFVFEAGRSFGKQHGASTPLQTLHFVAEAWHNYQEPGKDKPFLQPADDPNRQEIIVVEEANFLTPEGAQVKTLCAPIERDTQGKVTCLGTPTSFQGRVVNQTMALFIRGMQSAKYGDEEFLRMTLERLELKKH